MFPLATMSVEMLAELYCCMVSADKDACQRVAACFQGGDAGGAAARANAERIMECGQIGTWHCPHPFILALIHGCRHYTRHASHVSTYG